MIKKQTERNDQPDDLASLVPTVICEKFTLRGNIKQTRAIRIEGTIIGNIEQAETVVIGMTGTIRGNVNNKKTYCLWAYRRRHIGYRICTNKVFGTNNRENQHRKSEYGRGCYV